MPQFPVQARTMKELQNLANPPAGSGIMETVPGQFYDSELYTSAATTELRIFATTKQSLARSNMEAAGQFPAPQFLECYYQTLDAPVPPSDTALESWGDLWAILFGDGTDAGIPHWTLSMSGKEYARATLSTLHGTGGPIGAGFATTTATDTTIAGEYANNSVPDGGWCWDGALLIPPSVGFSVTLSWPEPVTLAQGNRLLYISLWGAHARRVL